MPFPIVFGLPSHTSFTVKQKLRADIIKVVAEKMNIPEKVVRPFFPDDQLGPPDKGQDDAIYCRIDTGMYHGKPETTDAQEELTAAVAKVIYEALNGLYGVVCFVGDLDGKSETVLKPKPQ